jgi:hypothetical protein
MKKFSSLQSDVQLAQELSRWEQTFRADAQADSYQVFRKLLQSLGLPDEPTLLLDGTIMMIQRSIAFLALDGINAKELLMYQQYDPMKGTELAFNVTFDIHSKAYARIILPASLKPLDLADLYESSWNEYAQVGFCDFWISRIDGASLSANEIADFEATVEYDLRYDYTEDELAFWFDPDSHEGILKVSVQDVFGDEQFMH